MWLQDWSCEITRLMIITIVVYNYKNDSLIKFDIIYNKTNYKI